MLHRNISLLVYFFFVSQCFEFNFEFLCYFILAIPKQLIIVGRGTLASNERKYNNFFYYFWGNGGVVSL